MIEISIIIVSYNTRDLLDKCLTTVAGDSPHLSREVIVIDNASADGTVEMLKEKWPHVRLIENKENVGYAPACNQGLCIAMGRYFLALNSDAFPRDDALEKMVEFMDENEDVAAISPILLNEDGTIQLSCARKDQTFFSLLVYYGRIEFFLRALSDYARRLMPIECYHRVTNVECLSGACLLFRQSALKSVGLLNDSLIINYDDVEWCRRARLLGHRLVLFPGAEMTHLGGHSRQFDPDREKPTNLISTFRYFDIRFMRPCALLLKLVMSLTFAMSIAKNIVLLPFAPNRKKRLFTQTRMLALSLRLAFRRTSVAVDARREQEKYSNPKNRDPSLGRPGGGDHQNPD